jgi:hypothetical protein
MASMIASIWQQSDWVEQFASLSPPSHLPIEDSHEGLELPHEGLELPHDGPELPHLGLELPQGLHLPPLGSHFGAHGATQVADSRIRFSNDSIADAGTRDHRDCRTRRLQRGRRSEPK